jgi:hypothetical protein
MKKINFNNLISKIALHLLVSGLAMLIYNFFLFKSIKINLDYIQWVAISTIILIIVPNFKEKNG